MRKTREERQEEICVAAKKLFLTKGFKQTTMEDIVAMTTLSKGGLYHYFGSTKAIMIHMMERFNVLYQNENPYMLALDNITSQEDIRHLVLEALLDKILVVTDDRKLYWMFCQEMMFDEDIRKCFFKLEEEFLVKLSERMCVPYEKNLKEKVFVSRLINAILLTQNLIGEPEVFEERRDEFREIFGKYIDAFL